jgi:hypothetical protein
MLIKIHYDLSVFSAQFQIQRVDALYFIADPQATRAQDAPVSVNNQEVMGGINPFTGPVPFEHDMIDAELIR